MLVTVIADASYCPSTQAAGWGIWAISKRGKFGHGGSMDFKVDGSCAAEMMAVVNGLYYAAKKGIAISGDHVLLQTDCLSAINIFKKGNAGRTHEASARKKLYALKKEYGLTLSFRHVKGHSRSPEARYVTNNLCDKRAKAGMRLAREKFGGFERN